MTTARRRWLSVAAGVLAVVVLVLAWSALQAERRTDAAQPVPVVSAPSSSSTSAGQEGSARQGDSAGQDASAGTQAVEGGGLATSPDALGTPDRGSESGADSATGESGVPDGSPIAPWWQRVPPVAGTLLPINRLAAGRVRIENVPDTGLVIRFHDLRVATIGTPPRTLRVLLSAQPVIGSRRGFWADDGTPVVVGDIPADVPSQSLTLANPRVLPPEVRSLILYDAETGELLGGASLIPTD